MNSLKAVDTLNHDLLLAKLHGHGFDRGSLKVFHSYLSNKIKEQILIKVLICGVKLFLDYQKILFLVLSSLIFI